MNLIGMLSILFDAAARIMAVVSSAIPVPDVFQEAAGKRRAGTSAAAALSIPDVFQEVGGKRKAGRSSAATLPVPDVFQGQPWAQGVGALGLTSAASRGNAALALQTMSRRSSLLRVIMIFMATVSVSACVSPGAMKSSFDPTVPQIGYLKARVDALYQAEQAKDWRSFYSITSPELRKGSSYEDFLKESSSRTFDLLSWRISGITSEGDPGLPTGMHGAKVQMDVRIEERGGRIERDTDQTDYWQFLDGEWYWTWRGWPND